MTASEAPVCDCPEPCGCYAEGKDKARTRTRPTSRSGQLWRSASP